MKTEKEILEAIEEIKKDSRYKSKCATVFSNAPLALIQMGLESEIKSLKWVLNN